MTKRFINFNSDMNRIIKVMFNTFKAIRKLNRDPFSIVIPYSLLFSYYFKVSWIPNKVP